MTDTQPPAGADLARQAVRQARAAALARGAAPKVKKPQRRRMPRGEGREPALFGGILAELAIAYNWTRPSAGAQLLAMWPDLMGDRAGMAMPERYDAETHTLVLRPVSPAAGTWLRLNAADVIARLSTAVGPGTLERLDVRAPGGAAARPAPAVESAPVPVPDQLPPRTREQAPDGFHQALGVALAGRTTPAAVDLHQGIRDRNFADGRNTLREPTRMFAGGLAALEEAASQTGGNKSDEIRERALMRAREEKAGRAPAGPRPLDRTA